MDSFNTMNLIILQKSLVFFCFLLCHIVITNLLSYLNPIIKIDLNRQTTSYGSKAKQKARKKNCKW